MRVLDHCDSGHTASNSVIDKCAGEEIDKCWPFEYRLLLISRERTRKKKSCKIQSRLEIQVNTQTHTHTHMATASFKQVTTCLHKRNLTFLVHNYCQKGSFDIKTRQNTARSTKLTRKIPKLIKNLLTFQSRPVCARGNSTLTTFT